LIPDQAGEFLSLPTPSPCCAFSGAEVAQQANSCVTKRQNKHVCIDAHA